MKFRFSIDVASLSKRFNNVAKLAMKKNILTILDNVLFTVSDGTITITGSDVDNAISTTIPATNVEGEGSFCINARKFGGLLKELPSGPISVSVDTETKEAEVSNVFGKYKLSSFDGADFPIFKYDTELAVSSTCVNGDLLAKGLDAVSYVVDVDNNVQTMAGIRMDMTEDTLTLVGAVAARLVRCRVKASSESATGLTLSMIAAGLLSPILNKDDEVKISTNGKCAVFQSGEYTIWTTLIKGAFPDYNRVIPASSDVFAILNSKDLVSAVKRIRLVTDMGWDRLAFGFSADTVSVSGNDISCGSKGHEDVGCSFSGESMKIGLKGGYVIDMCSKFPGDEVQFGMTSKDRPVVVTPVTPDEEIDMVGLIMPMVLND